MLDKSKPSIYITRWQCLCQEKTIPNYSKFEKPHRIASATSHCAGRRPEGAKKKRLYFTGLSASVSHITGASVTAIASTNVSSNDSINVNVGLVTINSNG